MPAKQSRAIERPPRPEKRAEPRQAASGPVRFRQSGVLAGSFAGQLIDAAAHGFRARHNRLTLSSGQLVDFEFDGHSGLACAVWTRIVDGAAETGFRILPEPGE
jgi:hypothetical protein